MLCCFRQHISRLCGTEFQISSLCVSFAQIYCLEGVVKGNWMGSGDLKFKFTNCVQIWVVGSIPGAWLCGVSMFSFCLSGWVLQVLRLFMHASYACKPCSLISMWLLHLFSTRWRSHISTQLQRSAVFRRPGGGMLGRVRSLRFALGLLLLHSNFEFLTGCRVQDLLFILFFAEI